MQRRRGGLTTGGLLQAIGDAVAHPEIEVPYMDHAMIKPHQLMYIELMAKDLIERLDLNMTLRIKGSILYIKSNHEPIYVDKDGRAYKRIG